MFSKLTLIGFCCLIFLSCSSEEQNELKINFSPDSTTIIFSGLDEVNIFRAKEQMDSLASELISVIETADDGREKPFTGKTIIEGNSLTFVPDTPFVRGRSYIVQTLLNSSFGKTTDVLKADVGRSVKRQEKILER